MVKVAILAFVMLMMAFCIYVFIRFIFDLMSKHRMKRIYEYEEELNKD